MTSLIIVESDEKAKSLKDQMGSDTESVVLRSAPMRVTHNPKKDSLHEGEDGYGYIPSDQEKDFARHLLNSLSKDIYFAFDGDQRGDLWSWMIGRFLFMATKGAKTTKRMHVRGFQVQEIEESFQNCLAVDNNVAAVSYIRSLFSSSLMGHIKRLLGTGNGPGGLPLHYISLTIMFLLEDRNGEIEAFSVPPRWRLKTRLFCLNGELDMCLEKAPGVGEDGCMKEAEQVKRAVALFEKEKILVQNVDVKEFSLQAPTPYRVVDLLHDSHIHLGIGPADVFRALQKMYNGIEIKGKNTGLITSPFLADVFDYVSVLCRIRQHVENKFGGDKLDAREIDGHVILPLQPSMTAEDLGDGLSREEGQLYELIRCRSLASQMLPAVGQRYDVDCLAGPCHFKGSRSFVNGKGFLEVFKTGYDSGLLQDCFLADVTKGQELRLEKILPEKTGASSGEYYTYETLFDDLAEFSIQLEGPALILLQGMFDKNYLTIDGAGGFHSQQNIHKVAAIVNRAFPGMKGINLSAYFEQTVNEVVTGRKPLDFALKQFDQNFIMHGVALVQSAPSPQAKPVLSKRSSNIIKSPDLADLVGTKKDQIPPGEEVGQDEVEAVPDVIEALPEEMAVSAESTLLPAESDAAEVADDVIEEASPVDDEWLSDAEQEEKDDVEALSDVLPVEEEPDDEKEAVKIAESLFVEEEPPVDIGEDISAGGFDVSPVVPESPSRETDQGKICPSCSRPLLLKRDAYGQYWSCSGYPACRHSESFSTEEEFKPGCPVCHHESIAIKRTPTGKKLYTCSSADCEFMAWSKPHAIVCPNCSSPFLVEKKGAGGKTVLRCPRAGCSYLQPLVEEGGDAVDGGEEPAKKKVLVRRSKGSASSGKKKKVVVRRRK